MFRFRLVSMQYTDALYNQLDVHSVQKLLGSCGLPPLKKDGETPPMPSRTFYVHYFKPGELKGNSSHRFHLIEENGSADHPILQQGNADRIRQSNGYYVFKGFCEEHSNVDFVCHLSRPSRRK